MIRFLQEQEVTQIVAVDIPYEPEVCRGFHDRLKKIHDPEFHENQVFNSRMIKNRS